MTLLAPSLLSADFSRIGEEVRAVEKAGADWLHVDVMDGHFVPNLTIGPLVVEALKGKTKLKLDCHLMVARPEQWVEAFVEAGAEVITVHAEATSHLERLLQHIRAQKVMAGVSINPATPLSAIEEVLDAVDLVLIMSVNPGFGGQKFIPQALSKVERLRDMRGARKFLIEVDGGVTAENAASLQASGADVLVAGSAIFGKPDRSAAIAAFRKVLKEK